KKTVEIKKRLPPNLTKNHFLIMKKHICNKEKTVEVEGYIAIRENKVVYVEPHKRCRPTNKK
ncbi:hypothetical protein, partial [Bacteroides sp.]|uniref:hypothetical protein n=1 Tax=Bacteroides sp. TaxID=29523 RepID=UPI00259084D5